MATSIEPLRPEHQPAVAAFNARLAAGGETFSFPETTRGLLTPESPESTVRQTAYVLVDGADIHGGYILKSERFHCDNREWDVGNLQLPLSEGTVDRRFGIVGIQLVKDALSRQPRLYCLGMGSLERPLPRLLARLGWTVTQVPFLFRVIHARRFLQHIVFLRQRPAVRIALDIARWSGLGSVANVCHTFYMHLSAPKIPSDVCIAEVDDFGADADRIFNSCALEYGLISDRRAATLRQKLPLYDKRLVRLVLRRGSTPIGWVVISRSQLVGHRQFGSMRLGTIVDGLGPMPVVPWLIRAAVDRLVQGRVDLIVSNQTNNAWLEALRRAGFAEGPSNFILARSPAFVAVTTSDRLHFTRCDGDGPINL